MRSVPHLLVAAAAVMWLIAGLVYDVPLVMLLGLALIAAGVGVAAWVSSRNLRAAGFAAGCLGMLLFISGFGTFAGIGFLASVLFALALAAAALAELTGPSWLPRLGWTVGALGALLWIYNDLNSLAWEPGNVAAFVGAAWLAVKPR